MIKLIKITLKRKKAFLYTNKPNKTHTDHKNTTKKRTTEKPTHKQNK